MAKKNMEEILSSMFFFLDNVVSVMGILIYQEI